MELEEAIEELKNMTDGYTFKDCFMCLEYDENECKCEYVKAINTVLKELDRLHFYREERETIKSNLEIDLNRKGVLAQAKGQIHEILQIYKTNDKYLEDKEKENE